MTALNTAHFHKFLPATPQAKPVKVTPAHGVWSLVVRALETYGRKRAIQYFARKSDLELAQLGLTRATLAERLSAE